MVRARCSTDDIDDVVNKLKFELSKMHTSIKLCFVLYQMPLFNEEIYLSTLKTILAIERGNTVSKNPNIELLIRIFGLRQIRHLLDFVKTFKSHNYIFVFVSHPDLGINVNELIELVGCKTLEHSSVDTTSRSEFLSKLCNLYRALGKKDLEVLVTKYQGLLSVIGLVDLFLS